MRCILIKPESVFARIEGTINEFMTSAVLPPEFRMEFRIRPQTLEFDMLDDDHVKLIIAVVTTIIKRIQEKALSEGIIEHDESIYFPFETQAEQDKSLMIINIKYRNHADFIGNRISVVRD